MKRGRRPPSGGRRARDPVSANPTDARVSPALGASAGRPPPTAQSVTRKVASEAVAVSGWDSIRSQRRSASGAECDATQIHRFLHQERETCCASCATHGQNPWAWPENRWRQPCLIQKRNPERDGQATTWQNRARKPLPGRRRTGAGLLQERKRSLSCELRSGSCNEHVLFS